jgi:hypothetical protein
MTVLTMGPDKEDVIIGLYQELEASVKKKKYTCSEVRDTHIGGFFDASIDFHKANFAAVGDLSHRDVMPVATWKCRIGRNRPRWIV